MQARKIAKANEVPSSQPSETLCSSAQATQNLILTGKELHVLELVSYGYDNRAIADYFQTSRQAVKNMMRVIHLKLGADNRAHAVAVCFRNGWFTGRQNAGSDSSPRPEPGFPDAGAQVGKLYALSAPPRDGHGPANQVKFRP
jgi:DNA-binding CsgD family transcriptional regulator